MTKLRILFFTLSLAFSMAGFSSVPKRRTATHLQSDGSSLVISLMANGRFSIYQTSDGVAVLPDGEGNFLYAMKKGNDLVQSSIFAHEPEARTAEEKTWLSQHKLTASDANYLLKELNPPLPLLPLTRSAASTEDGLGKFLQSGLGAVKSIGSPVIPVIMAEFADVAFQDTITAEKITRFFNEEGYHDETYAKASVRDFFVNQSQGLFTPSFVVVAKVKVPQNRAYYGADAANGSIDTNGTQYIADALAEAEKIVDFSTYATSGKVPLVAVIYPGPGQHSSFESGCDDYLWAKFNTSRFTVNNGNITVGSYLMANELLQNYTGTAANPIVTDTHLDGIGLFSHEFGHALGLPDLYYTGSNATVSDTLKTMDYWDIMDYGQYYMNGYMPTGYTAYERSNLGWLDVKELKDAQFAQLYPYGRESEGPTAYVLRNPEDEREYYLLENRQKDTFYPSRMGKGMLITHVDYLYAKWAGNAVNNEPDHQRMAYVPADNVKDGTDVVTTATDLFNGYKGDLFPGRYEVTSFTDDTTPAATLFNGTTGKLSLPLYNITLTDDNVITFSFIDPTQTAIVSATTNDETLKRQKAFTLSGTTVSDLQNAPAGIYILQDGRKLIKK